MWDSPVGAIWFHQNKSGSFLPGSIWAAHIGLYGLAHMGPCGFTEKKGGRFCLDPSGQITSAYMG